MFTVDIFPINAIVGLPIGARVSVDEYGNACVEVFVLADGKRITVCSGNSAVGRVECRSAYDLSVDLRISREICGEIVRECERLVKNALANIDAVVNTCRILLRQLLGLKT